MLIQVAFVTVLFVCAQYYAWAVGRDGRLAHAQPLPKGNDRGIRHRF